MKITCKCRALGGKSLPAFIAASSASDRGASSNRHVTELTCAANHSVVNLSVEYYSGTKSFLHEHKYEVPNVANFRTSKPELRQRRGVRVVIYAYRHAGSLGKFISNGPITPFEMWNKQRGAGFSIHKARQTDTNTFNRRFARNEVLN